MAKRPAAPADDALFDVARPKGATERSVERSLALWRAGGRDVDPVTSRMLEEYAVGVADLPRIGLGLGQVHGVAWMRSRYETHRRSEPPAPGCAA